MMFASCLKSMQRSIIQTVLPCWLIFILLSGNSPKPGTTAPSLPEITSRSEEGGFVDLLFRLENVHFDNSGNCTLLVSGQLHGQRVGMKVVVAGHMKPGITSKGDVDKSAFREQGVMVTSRGQISDNFVKVLAKLYGTKRRPTKMKSQIIFTCFPLEEDSIDVKTHPVKLKLFVGEKQDYAELYLNINVTRRELELNEKDPEYREAIIKAFGIP